MSGLAREEDLGASECASLHWDAYNFVGMATLRFALLAMAGGIAPHDADLACDLLPQIATTAAVERATWASSGSEPGAQATVSQPLYELFSSLPSDQFPNLTTYVGALIDGPRHTGPLRRRHHP